jgi:hypothetical protein
MRILYGNHDAWPGTLPILAGGGWRQRSELQRSRLSARLEWWEERWRDDPLYVDIPGTSHRIELYALNSVCFGAVENTQAIGRVNQEDLKRLALAIKEHHRASEKSYRILATHHPVAFPFDKTETSIRWLPLIRTMHLAGAHSVIEFLKNDTGVDATPELSPYIHLFLAGHTHASFPGTPLPRTVKEAYHGPLGDRQMQLVGGPLMLVRDRERVAQDTLPRIRRRTQKDFPQPLVFDANQQFEILRFSYKSDSGGGLLLRRYVLARTPNEPDYMLVPELGANGQYATSLLY